MPRWTSAALAVLLAVGAAAAAAAADCRRADAIFAKSQATADPAAQEDLLGRALAECPEHAKALNDLGMVREGQHRLDEAERLYRQAIAAQPNLVAAYAGLGDVLAARDDHRGAVSAYTTFVTLLAADRRTGTADPYAKYEADYRGRLATQLSLIDPNQIVSAEAITRSLAPPGGAKRAMMFGAGPPAIDIQIQFATNSDQLDPSGQAQLEQVARALADAALAGTRIRIEGHTDATGDTAYNRELSQRRAERVRAVLAERGIPRDRLEATGRGAELPLVPNDDEAGRALNRRVTFVNLGVER